MLIGLDGRRLGAIPMPYGVPPLARQLEDGRFNRFLATLPPHDFSLLAPHLRTLTLERGAMLHDVGEQIAHVYFPHTGMVSFVAVMQSGATVETATLGRAGVIGGGAGVGGGTAPGGGAGPPPGAGARGSGPPPLPGARHKHAPLHPPLPPHDLFVL